MNSPKKKILMIKRRVFSTSLLLAFLVLCAGCLLFMVLDRAFILPALIRVSFVSLAISCFLLFLIRGLLKIPTPSEIAWRLEKLYPQFKGRLATIIDYNSSKRSLGYSSLLLKKTEKDAKRIFDRLSLFSVMNKRFYITLSSLIVVLGLLLIAGDRPRFLRLINPTTAHFSLDIHVEPDRVILGGDSDIYITPHGIQPKNLWLVIEGERVRLKQSLEGFHHRIENLRENLHLYASLSDVVSEKKEIQVLTPPILRNWSYEYTFPCYTGLPGHVQQRGDIYGLVGTSVRLTGESNTPLQSVRMSFKGLDTTYLIQGLDNFEMDLVIREQDTMSIFLESTAGLLSEEYRIAIHPYPDEYPEVEIISPERIIDIPREMELKIRYRVSDDFGVTSAYLATIFRGDTSKKLIIRFSPPVFDTVSYFDWDISHFSILPGDTLLYYLIARDNDGFKGPKISRTPLYRIRFPSLVETYERLAQETDIVEGGVESILEKIDKIGEKLERLTEKETLSIRDKEAIEEILFEREEIKKELGDLSKRMEDLISEMDRTIFLDEETRTKMKEVERRLRELETDEVREAREKLKEALEKDPQLLKEALRDFRLTEEEFKERLERTLAFLEKLQSVQELRRITEEVSEIRERQEGLKEALERGADPEDMADAQAEIQEEIRDIEEALRELSHKLPQISEGLKKEAETALKIASSMKTAQMDMEAGEMPSSLMDQISESLSALTESLMDLQNMMRGEALRKDLRKNLVSLLLLSREQEKVLKEEVKDRFTSRQKALYEGIERLKESLSQSLAQVRGGDGVIALLEPVLASAKESEQLAEMGKLDSGRAKGRDVMRGLNAVSYELLNLESAMGAKGEGLPSLAQMFEALAEMAQAQMGLNQLAMSLFPMGIGEGAIQRELAELARRQAELARALREMAGEGEGRILGDLSAIAGKMESLASDIGKYGLTEEIFRRQTSLLKYLLTAQRSLYRERESVRRISRPGREFLDILGPDELLLETKRGVSQRDILRALMRAHPEEYESLIRAYFRALSIE